MQTFEERQFGHPWYIVIGGCYRLLVFCFSVLTVDHQLFI